MDEQARAEQAGAQGSRTADVRPSRHSAPTGAAPLPPVPGAGSPRAAGPRRPPTTGSIRRPTTGSRPAARRRRDLRWVPIALAIWVGSFLAIPAAVLAHDALSDAATPVKTAADTRDQGDADQPAAPATADPPSVQPASQRPVTEDPAASSATSGANPAATTAGDVAPAMPPADSTSPGTAVPPASPTLAAAPTSPTLAAAPTSSTIAATPTTDTDPTVSSMAEPSANGAETPPPDELVPAPIRTCQDCPPV